MREFRQPEGLWRLRSERAELLAPALELARLRHAAQAGDDALAGLAGTSAWYEHDRPSGRARWRLLLRRLPRLAEYADLEWLRARAFLAPRPLAAGALTRGGLPIYEFLVVERVEGAETLAEFLARRDDPLRAGVLEELAREAARMHGLHGRRRELGLRDVLVQRAGSAGRVHFRAASLRGPDGLLREARAWLADAERERFLGHYAQERAAQS